MNLLFLSFKIFGVSVVSLRGFSALAGTLTVFGLYLLTKEILKQYGPLKFKKDTIALLASFFLSVSFWHINFSRIGFRAIMLPLILVYSFYFFFWGLRGKNWKLAVSGIIFGLGFYTYSTFKLMPILILAVLFYVFVTEKASKKKIFLRLLFFFCIPVLITFLPLALYFLKNPSDIIGRLGPISVFAQPTPIKAFFESLGAHLLMFNFRGDGNWRHNLPNSPQIFWPVGIAFIIGFFWQIRTLISCFKTKNSREMFLPLFCLGWFFIAILGGVLTYEGIPHALRTIGIIPVVYIFSAMGAYIIFDFLKSRIKKKAILNAFIVFFFLFVTFFSYKQYFVAWAGNENVDGAFTKPFVEMGNYLNSLGDNYKKYVIVNEPGVAVPYPDGVPVSAQTLMFIERTKFKNPRTVYIRADELYKIADQENAIILLMRDNEEILKELTAKFPRGVIQKNYPIITFAL